MARVFMGTSAHPAEPILLVVPIGALLASGVIRFILLPRKTTHTTAVPFFMSGLALAEGAGNLH